MSRLSSYLQSNENIYIEGAERYIAELTKFNKTINLVSPASLPNADMLHVLDSIMACRFISFNTSSQPFYDLGSGNGCPGLLAALFYPNSVFILVDSDSRKIEFLKHCIHILKLTNCSTLCCRVEDMPSNAVNNAVCRGFSSLKGSIDFIGNRIGVGGKLFSLKASSFSNEIDQADSSVSPSSWTHRVVGEYSLPHHLGDRVVVCSERIN